MAEVLDARYRVLAEGRHHPPASLHRSFAPTRMASLQIPREDAVAACIDDLRGLHSVAFEGPHPSGDPAMRLLPVVGPGVGKVGTRHQLEVVCREGEPAAKISPGELIEHGTNDLDVLLRHRPPSISRRGAAFHAKRIAAFRPKHYSDGRAASRVSPLNPSA
jgi:hypothetical protein